MGGAVARPPGGHHGGPPPVSPGAPQGQGDAVRVRAWHRILIY